MFLSFQQDTVAKYEHLEETATDQILKTTNRGLTIGSGASDWPITLTTTGVIVKSLFRSRNFIWENDHKVVEQFGLTWGQFETLVALRFAGAPYQLSPTQLYDAAQISSGGLTKILIGLEKMGLIVRTDNPDDQRSRFVRLAPKGRKMVEKIVDQLASTNGDLLAEAMEADDREELARLLGKLADVLERRD